MNAEFQRIVRRDKKAFFSNQCKEIEENNRMGKTRDLFKKIRDTKGTFHAKMFSHPYMTTGKTIALPRRTFVGKVLSLLLNMLPRFVILFLPRSKCLLISWLQSPSAVILEPKKIKSDTVSTVSPSIPHEEMGLDAMIFVF